MDNSPYLWSLTETRQALASKACSAEELTKLYLARIERFNPKLHAYLAVSDTALASARRIDELRMRQPERLGPLAGIPLAMKDLFDTTDLPTTHGGKHFRDTRPSRPAAAVDRLTAAGAIILGKTNLHEYAFGTTNENPHYGTTLNPWNRAKITGGSSGGSANAVAAGLCVAALGTDTGGSVRIPAAFCGVVGVKPTFGRISRSGVLPLAPSLDCVGTLTRYVADAALLIDVLSGYDAADDDSLTGPYDTVQHGAVPLPIRVGVPTQFFFERCHTGVLATVQAALRVLRSGVVETRDVDIPHLDEVPAAQAAILGAEALFVHEERLREAPADFGADVRERLEAARQIGALDYAKALVTRHQFREEVCKLFDVIDVLITPATPLIATDVGQMKAHVGSQEVPVRSQLTRYTNPWNLSGLPAISIPCGMTSDLPVGLQLIAAPLQERKLLAIAQVLEQVFQWTPVAPDFR